MPLLFLNEKSCRTKCDASRAEKAMTEFARTAVAVAKVDRADTTLVCEAPMGQLMIADGYPAGKWLGDSKHRDLRLRLLQLQTKAPFRSVFPDGEDAFDVEYRHEGEVVHGLGGAHLMDGVSISLPVHARWDSTLVALECEQLVEGEDGTPHVDVRQVEVRHVSAERHVDAHLAWIRLSKAAAVHTGGQLWERRADLFPHLRFLPRVEDDLRELPQMWVDPVRRRLIELEDAVTGWDPEVRPEGPVWHSRVTGEHEGRRRLCRFTDLDGVERVFDLHARFTPGAGRAHFRLVPAERTVRVAYLGRKLGI